jgi:predicted HAD superfamily Cof-like phosphohydrolase
MKQLFKVYDTTPYIGMTMLQMLTQFHNKFGTPYDGKARELSNAELQFRLVCHLEEAKEYKDAVLDGQGLVEQLDALADELYFLTGTAHRQGFDESVTEVNVNLGCPRVKPHALNDGSYLLRFERHDTVLRNYQARAERGDLVGMVLALNEAIRAFRATAQMHCFDIDEALRRVHAANMTKNTDPAKQRRTKALAEEGIKADHLLEITKPDGWLPPYLGDLVGLGPYEPEAETAAPAEPLPSYCGLITIDGPDASGKSTLAARIAEVTGGQVIHLTWSPQLERNMHHYRLSAINYARALAVNCVVVLERPWLSHPVYAEVYRGGNFFAGDVRSWKQATEEAALLNIIALPGNADLWLTNYLQMCEEREELHGPNPGKAMAVYEGFRDAFTGEAGHERQPGSTGAPVEVFDMQQFTVVDIDAYIAQHVLPVLAHKE